MSMDGAVMLLCSGRLCPLQLTCRSYVKWLSGDEDDDDLTMEPAFNDGKCGNYIQIEFYGQ